MEYPYQEVHQGGRLCAGQAFGVGGRGMVGVVESVDGEGTIWWRYDSWKLTIRDPPATNQLTKSLEIEQGLAVLSPEKAPF